MGARVVNTHRVRNAGNVEDTAALDVRALRKAGLLVPGEVRQALLPIGAGVMLVADLGSPTLASLRLDFLGSGGRAQTIWLEARPTRFGGRRWFFVNQAGTLRAEILYLVDGLFRFRQEARLTYRCQSRGDVDAVLDRRTKLRARLSGTPTRGPARGRVRRKIAAELEQCERGLDLVLGALENEDAVRQEQQRRRRAASAARLEEARRAMHETQSTTPEWVVEQFSSVLDDLKARTRRSPRKEASDRQLPPPVLDGAHADAGLLRRLGYFEQGRVLGAQLGWPKAWLPEPDGRLFFLIDLRDERPCAVFIAEDGPRTTTQLFWLTQAKGRFGRSEYRFVCPQTGKTSGALIYAAGAFALPSQPKRRPKRQRTRDESAVEPLLGIWQSIDPRSFARW